MVGAGAGRATSLVGSAPWSCDPDQIRNQRVSGGTRTRESQGGSLSRGDGQLALLSLEDPFAECCCTELQSGKEAGGQRKQASKQTDSHALGKSADSRSCVRDSGEGQPGGVVDARGDQPMMELAWVAVGDGAF